MFFIGFIKYSGDADKLTEIVGKNEGFKHLRRDAVDVLNACVNAKLVMSKDEEECDVCLAIQSIADRAADAQNIKTLLKKCQAFNGNYGLECRGEHGRHRSFR